VTGGGDEGRKLMVEEAMGFRVLWIVLSGDEMMRLLFRLLICVLLLGCYGGDRDNPLDPELTPAVELDAVAVEDTRGAAILEWTEYAGQQPFAAYRILRKERGLEAVDTLGVIEDVHRTTFRDTTLAPDVEYVYRVAVVNRGGFVVESEEREVSYRLPPVDLLWAELSSVTAAAELAWTVYRGPGFEAYEVHRQAGGLGERIVTTRMDMEDTTYTDMPLDGNTTYTYWISVRTTWGITVSSNELDGEFYALTDVQTVQGIDWNTTKPRAVGLALDEQDDLYVAMTMISTTTARNMQEGVSVALPGQALRRSLSFTIRRLARLSPVHIRTGDGKVYVSAASDDGRVLVAALDGENLQRVWTQWVNTAGAFPVGLHLEENGDLLMVDAEGLLYRFGADGDIVEEASDDLQVYLEAPLRQVVVGPGAGLGGDQFFLLAPERGDHQVLGNTRLPNGLFGGGFTFDEGVGLGRGQTLNPVALAFDSARKRLLVLEAQGRLQILDGRPDAERRYITEWGTFGTGDGEFQVSLPISAAMEVDSAGRIYVADESGRIQVFTP